MSNRVLAHVQDLFFYSKIRQVAQQLGLQLESADPSNLQAKVQASATTRQEIAPGVFVNLNTAGTYTSQGIFERIASVMDRYIKPTEGVLSRQSKSIDDQIKDQNDRIDRINEGLDRKKARLQAQFLAMEKAIGKITSQQGAISGIASLK